MPQSSSEAAPTVIRWRSLVAAIAAVTAVGMAMGLGLPLLSVILEKRGISSSMIGFNSAMAGIASMMAAPLTTRLAHRFGAAPTMVGAIIIAALSALGFYYAPHFWMWFPLRFTFHGAISTLFILSEFWINAAAPPHRRGLVLGCYATVMSLGFAAGPLIFSATGSAGLLPFAIGATIILAAAIPVIIARNDGPSIDTAPDLHFFRYIFAVPSATAAVFIFGAVEAGGLSLFPIFATRSAFSEQHAALLLTLMGVGNLIFQIPIGMITDHLKDRRQMLLALAIIGFVGALSLPLIVHSFMLTAIVLLFFGGSIAGLYTVGLSHMGTRFSGANLAAANAAFIFCYAIGTVIGPQAIGSAMDVAGKDGFAGAIAIFFGLYLLLAVVRLVFRRRQS
ncbi:MFS transporter [Martelella alba]|uniref:MFS transporter n=1 Tax=Martelella alba TaxID=2590451 RepID=A0A506U502_9HYPH|nr:MFS transporter [Martelella alba]TPW28035.1 MFS transporter [Martelella alba]